MINATQAKKLSQQISQKNLGTEMAALESQFGYLNEMVKERIDQGMFFLIFEDNTNSYKEQVDLRKFLNLLGYTVSDQSFGASPHGRKLRIDW